MIDPAEPLETQVEKQAKIIDALIKRANRGHDVGSSAYSLFQSAIALQGEVSERTKDLERALDTLGQASNELESVQFAREQTQKNLAVALDVMEGGFALFTDNKLQICNDLFRNLIADVSQIIAPGLDFETYCNSINQSSYVKRGQDVNRISNNRSELKRTGAPVATFVLALKNNRWVQITQKRTSLDSIVMLQTEITGIVRKNRREKDKLIDEQTHFLQAAFDHMSQGVCTFSAEGTLLIHNSIFGELLGLPYRLTREGTAFGQILDFIKKNQLLRLAYPNEDIDTWIDQFRVDNKLKGRIRHVSGGTYDLQVHRLPDDGFIVNVLDVTAESQTTELLEKRVQERTSELTDANSRLRQQYDEQAKVEEELRIAKEEAEAAVSSKTRFFAAASHDLLQPINAAKLFISTLKEESRGTGMEETMDRLNRSFTSIESLLHALLDIARLDSTGAEFSVTAFSIDEILHFIKQDYSPLACEKGLRISIVPSTIWVQSDQRYLLRSVQNLVVNAIQYTEKGRILVGCRRDGNQVRLEVWDTGIGISKKNQKRIFNEFMRVKTSKFGYGMGLGLSIVERACRHLGHNVEVRSKPGIGSTFSIELPMVEPVHSVVGPKPERSFVPQDDMDLIVVIVENDPEVLFATTQKLENWGASVLGAKSTKEAVKLVREIGIAPDIILADYQLDGGDDGIKSIVALRNQTKTDIPAIMITANRKDSLIKAGHKHGFTVLTKPVQLSRLRPLIDWKTGNAAAELADKNFR
ncbi:MAG: response regulator [Hyphomicrobiales bacterium]|nr:response regulator [Hyphomicrobiales bacterium]